MGRRRPAEIPSMRSPVVMLVLALPLLSVGCAHPHAAIERAGDWRLVYPPELPDQHYPKGVHLMGDAPMSTWSAGDAYASRDDCEAARARKIDETIDRARAEHGDAAKFELPVRRAVNARCIGAP